jgi:hypothetical protein
MHIKVAADTNNLESFQRGGDEKKQDNLELSQIMFSKQKQQKQKSQEELAL